MNHSDAPNLDRLDRGAVPPGVLEVLRRIRQAGAEAWLVGGAVRDLLRGTVREAADWDVATSARPEAVMRLFQRVVPTGLAHGTVTVLTPDGPVEVTTFRGEAGYSDARRPDAVHFLDDVEADLARRDFTINAIAWDPLDGRVVDPFGGVDDLKAGLVRTVGAPVDRFSEDGLRPLRAVRFASVLGMALDPDTEEAIPPALPSFRRIAVERVRQELEKMLRGPAPGRGVELLERTGLLAEILPRAEGGAARRRALDATPPDPALRLAALLRDLGPDGAMGELDRLRPSRALRDRVGRLLDPAVWEASTGDDPPLRRLLSRVGVEEAPAVAALWEAAAVEGREPLGAARARGRRLVALAEARPPVQVRDLALTGREVMRHLGTGPSPDVGRALAWLLDRVLDDPARNTPESLRSLLDRYRAGAAAP